MVSSRCFGFREASPLIGSQMRFWLLFALALIACALLLR